MPFLNILGEDHHLITGTQNYALKMIPHCITVKVNLLYYDQKYRMLLFSLYFSIFASIADISNRQKNDLLGELAITSSFSYSRKFCLLYQISCYISCQ